MQQKYFYRILLPVLLEIIHWSLGCVETQCPTSLVELDEFVVHKNWTLSDLEYQIFVKPEYFQYHDDHDGIPENSTVESKSEIKVKLEKTIPEKNSKNSLIMTLQCNLLIENYRMISLPTTKDFEAPEDSTASGFLYFEDLTLSTSSNQHYEIQGFFPVGNIPLSSIKGKYKLAVARPLARNYTVVSNMPLENTEPIADMSGWVWDHFQETVPLYPAQVSVYIIGDIVEKVEDEDEESNRKVSMIWRPSLATILNIKEEYVINAQKCFARVAAKILTFCESTFGVKYPVPKLDVVITSLKAANRNSIGVINAEHFLYYATMNGSCKKDMIQNIKPFISAIIQQWTGNLGVPSSKKSKALLKGLLDHLLHLAEDSVMGEKLGGVELFLYRIIPYMDSVDAGAKSLMGFKATALFKMFETLLTKPVFETGIIGNFIKKSVSSDVPLEINSIFEAIQNSIESHNKTDILPVGQSVKTVMESWLDTTGHPLIRVGIECLVDSSDSCVLTISQEIEYTNQTHVGFWIPLEIVTGSENQFTWLSPTTRNLTVTLSSPIKFVLVNPNITGYYKVLYDPTLTEMLATQLSLDHSVIPAVMRHRLIQEYFEFARNGYVGMDSALELTKYLTKEREPLVWYMTTTNINWGYWTKNVDAITHHILKNYFNFIIDTTLAEYYGFDVFRDKDMSEDGTSNVDDLSRRELMRACIWNKTPGCLNYAKELMTRWQGNPDIDPFSEFVDSDDLKCMALRGNFPGDETGFFDFYIEWKKNNSENNIEKQPCNLLVDIESAWLCSGNSSVLLTEYESILEKVNRNERCYGHTRQNVLSPTNIVNGLPIMVMPTYGLMKRHILNGTMEPSHLVDFLNLLEVAELQDSNLLISDLEQFLVEYTELNRDLDSPNVLELTTTVEELKEKIKMGDNEYARSGLKWLERNGY